MEKQTEKFKCDLARQPDMNLFQAFKLFDLQNLGFISPEDFVHHVITLTNRQYNRVLREQASYIFSRYNLDHN